MPLSWSQKRMECPPASGSLSISISNLSLKDEDRACTAVADVCGEAIELLLVADGHGGPEVRSTVKRPHWQLKRPPWLESCGLGPRLKYRWHPSAAQPFTLVVAQRTSAQPLGSSNHSAFYIQVAQLCFEAALPLVEKEAAAGGDASAASLQLGCTRAFERLHASAAAVSDRAGMPHPIQPPTVPYSPSRFASLYTPPLLCMRFRYDAHRRRLEPGPGRADSGACGGLGGTAGRGCWAGQASP